MRFVLVALALAIPSAIHAEEPFLLKDGQRVVFLGDSNTYAGGFIAHLDAYLCTRFPDRRFELINLGLPSETVSGLSEPDHPYPRPNIHDRVDRALQLTKPDVVVICYGMNDGIYYPFSAERFQKYQEAIGNLVKKVEAAGAKAILMSPSPFDPKPLKDKVLAKGAEKYSWMRPYEKYDDEVLARYSDYLLTWRKNKYVVVDAHTAVLKHLEAMRKIEPGYRVAGDGIHPDANGHLVIARELISGLNAATPFKATVLDFGKEKREEVGVSDLVEKDGAIAFRLTAPIPWPLNPKLHAKFMEVERVDRTHNELPLRLVGRKGTYQLFEGETAIGVFADEQWTKGINLAAQPKWSVNRNAAEIWKKVEEKNRVLGLAWLTHVGHKRPDTPKGIPLEEAKAKAASLDAEIRKLCMPMESKLRLVPVK